MNIESCLSKGKEAVKRVGNSFKTSAQSVGLAGLILAGAVFGGGGCANVGFVETAGNYAVYGIGGGTMKTYSDNKTRQMIKDGNMENNRGNAGDVRDLNLSVRHDRNKDGVGESSIKFSNYIVQEGERIVYGINNIKPSTYGKKVKIRLYKLEGEQKTLLEEQSVYLPKRFSKDTRPNMSKDLEIGRYLVTSSAYSRDGEEIVFDKEEFETIPKAHLLVSQN